MRYPAAEYTRERADLLELFEDATPSHPATVYTILRHVSRSGGTRVLSLVYLSPMLTGLTSPLRLSYAAAVVLGWPMREVNMGMGVAYGVQNCDAGGALVADLCSALGLAAGSLVQRWL